MMKYFRNTKGAVSVFLVLILVPTLTISALFVDAGKVSLARSVAASAGDLSLNTALTDYDTVLKDMYGLFATAQDTEELYGRLEEYYQTCITSSGVDDETAATYSEQLMAQLGLVEESNDTADILNMQKMDFNVHKVPDANLSNATILEKQIVDFMKYRAPINTGLSFLSSLQSFSTLSKQTDLVDKRRQYYEAEKSVKETLKKAWDEINEYNKTGIAVDGNYFSTMQNYLNSICHDEYQQLNSKVLMDLYDTQNYLDYQCSVQKMDNQKEKNAAGNEILVNGVWRFTYLAAGAAPFQTYIDYYPKNVGGYDGAHLPTEENLKELMANFYSAYQAQEAYAAEVGEFMNRNGSNPYELQYLVQMLRSENLSKYTSKIGNLYTIFQKLKNAWIWVDGYDTAGKVDSDGNPITAESIKNTSKKIRTEEGVQKTKTLKEHMESIETLYQKKMEAFSGTASYWTNLSGKYRGNPLVLTGDTETRVSGIASNVNRYITELEAAAAHLEAAKEALEEAKNAVSAGGSLTNAKEAWKGAADNPELKNTAIAKQDQAEIKELGSYLKSGEMEKLIKRLSNVAADLRSTAGQIKQYKFDDRCIGEITDYNTLISVMEKKNGADAMRAVPIEVNALNNTAASWFYWAPGNVQIGWTNDSGHQVNLHTQDKLNFYSYLYTQFNTGTAGDAAPTTTTKTEDKEGGKNLVDNIKNKSKENAETSSSEADSGSIGQNHEISGASNLPSAKKSGAETPSAEIETDNDTAAEKTSSNLGGMFSSLAGEAAAMGEDLRDKLYVSDYILSMFSYDTIEAEYKVESGKTNVTESDILSLKLKPINAANNFAYGKEVEYIIYGDTNAKNLTKAYGSIYGIRLAFNLIYAFMDAEIRDMAFAMATPISAATLGVVPVPLIQAAIIIGLACCESAIDLTELKDGKKVPLFKNKETWNLSVSGLVDYAKGKAGEIVKTEASKAVDTTADKLANILDKTDEELTENIDSIQQDLDQSLGKAFDTLVERHANMAIQKLTTLATNAVDEAIVNPGVSALDYVSKGLDKWLEEEAAGINTSTDIGYIAKAKAVEIIKNKYLSEVVAEMQNIKNGVTAGTENIQNKLNGLLTSIRESITAQLNQAGGKINSYKTELIQKAKNSVSQGADKLKDTINSGIDEMFGGASSGGVLTKENTGISSLLSFAYSDYLRLFLLIGLYTNEEKVILRTADVIQLNMAQITEKSGYALENSAVYVEASATVQVKPTLLALPLFADVQGNPVTNENWYTITYKDIRGY